MSLQYRIVETPTGATASIFVPGRAPMVVQSSHPCFEAIVVAAKEGDAGLVAWLVNGGDAPASVVDKGEAWLASQGKLGATPVASCPACHAPVSVTPGDVDKANLTCPFCGTEWNAFVVPDRIGAIVSWKGLVLAGADLMSPVQRGFRWEPGVAGVAKCSKGGRVPHDRCGCGIYSGKTRAHQVRLNYVNERNGVLAELHLSGRVVVATNGFKAEFARIHKLIIPTGSDLWAHHNARQVETLRSRWAPYGVDVIEEPLFSAEHRAKWCPACGHPAPADETVISCPACNTFLERG